MSIFTHEIVFRNSNYHLFIEKSFFFEFCKCFSSEILIFAHATVFSNSNYHLFIEKPFCVLFM